MSVRFHLDAFNTGTGAAGTTIARTGYGGTPKAFIVITTGRTDTSDAAGRRTPTPNIGFATSPTSRRLAATQSEDVAATSNTHRAFRDDAVVQAVSTAGASAGLLDIQSFDSDGLTFIIDEQFANSLRVLVIAILGDDITNASIVNYIERNTAGDLDVTGVGFDDVDFLFDIGLLTSAPNLLFTTASMTMGMVAWNGTSFDNVGLVYRARTGQPTTDTGTYSRGGESILATASANPNALEVRGGVSARITDGFRITFAEANGTRGHAVLCLKGGRHRVGSVLTQTDTTTPITVSGLPFIPRGAFFMSHCKAESDSDTGTSDVSVSLGAFDANRNAGAHAFSDKDNEPDSICAASVSHDSVYSNINPDGTLQGEAQLQSINTDGFSLIMSDADPVQSYLPYWVMGDTVGGPPLFMQHDILHGRIGQVSGGFQ